MAAIIKNKRLLPEAIKTAAVLAHQVASMGLFLAGTPEEIKDQLEAMNTNEITIPEVQP